MPNLPEVSQLYVDYARAWWCVHVTRSATSETTKTPRAHLISALRTVVLAMTLSCVFATPALADEFVPSSLLTIAGTLVQNAGAIGLIASLAFALFEPAKAQKAIGVTFGALVLGYLVKNYSTVQSAFQR